MPRKYAIFSSNSQPLIKFNNPEVNFVTQPQPPWEEDFKLNLSSNTYIKLEQHIGLYIGCYLQCF